jgi:prepilin-type N-terminal cleavage/methylation domain-containing protein/prepilin-type processing-associated H-X9-DG protein
MTQTQASRFTDARSARRGFTLVELLVVISIIAVLAATSFTMVGKMREKARESVCVGNLKQVGASLIMYYSELNNQPFLIAGTDVGSANSPIWPVVVATKGYLSNWDGQNQDAKPCGKGVWTCPASDQVSNNYGGYGVVQGIFKTPIDASVKPVRMVHVTSPEKTWLVGDVMVGTNPKKGWYAIWKNPSQWASGHSPAVGRHGGPKFNVCMFDGHVESLSSKQVIDGRYTNPVGIP